MVVPQQPRQTVGKGTRPQPPGHVSSGKDTPASSRLPHLLDGSLLQMLLHGLLDEELLLLDLQPRVLLHDVLEDRLVGDSGLVAAGLPRQGHAR